MQTEVKSKNWLKKCLVLPGQASEASRIDKYDINQVISPELTK